MLKAVLVDLDGTLVESAQANAAAYCEALSECGIVLAPGDVAPLVNGRSWRDFLPGLIGDRPGVAAENVARRKRALYPQYFHLLQLNRPLADLLCSLHGKFFVGLVTTASSSAVSAITEFFNLHDLFDVVICGDHVVRSKPHPEAYARAAEYLSVSPDECIVIEDSDTGVAAARAFGGSLLRWSPA